MGTQQVLDAFAGHVPMVERQKAGMGKELGDEPSKTESNLVCVLLFIFVLVIQADTRVVNGLFFVESEQWTEEDTRQSCVLISPEMFFS